MSEPESAFSSCPQPSFASSLYQADPETVAASGGPEGTNASLGCRSNVVVVVVAGGGCVTVVCETTGGAVVDVGITRGPRYAVVAVGPVVVVEVLPVSIVELVGTAEATVDVGTGIIATEPGLRQDANPTAVQVASHKPRRRRRHPHPLHSAPFRPSFGWLTYLKRGKCGDRYTYLRITPAIAARTGGYKGGRPLDSDKATDPDGEIITNTVVTPGHAGDASVAQELIVDLLPKKNTDTNRAATDDDATEPVGSRDRRCCY